MSVLGKTSKFSGRNMSLLECFCAKLKVLLILLQRKLLGSHQKIFQGDWIWTENRRHFHLTETFFQPPKWKKAMLLPVLQIRFWASFRCEEERPWKLDSRIFEDTQHVIQEIASKITNMKVLKTKRTTSKSDGFITC